MAITPGNSLNSVPAPAQQTLNTNYLDFQHRYGLGSTISARLNGKRS